MAFTPFETNTANISTLSDRPNQNDGLSSTQLKGRFDKAGNDIKSYINDVLLDELERTIDGDSGADNIGATAVGDGTATTVQGILEEIDADVTALDGAVVHKTGNEAINGIKDFKDGAYIKSFFFRNVGNAGQILGGTSEDVLSFDSGDLKFNSDLVWTEGNDGVGSGLDADTLDGRHDADMVHKSGAETIADVKTFTDSPIVPAPTADGNPATKKYVDDADALKVDIADIVNDLTTGGTAVPLSAEQGKTLKGEVGALASFMDSSVTNIVGSLSTKVPTTRKVNNKALSSNITLSASDVGALPSTDAGDLSNLTTTEKGTIVGAINEVDGHADTNATSIGTLASLTTTEKTNLVGAINELNADKIETAAIANTLTETAEGKVLDARQGKVLADLVSTNVGDLETLTTTDKSSLVNATNEVKNLVDTNKTNITAHDQKLTNIEMRFGTYDIVDTGDSPGNVRLLAGKPDAGFFGFVQPSEMGLITANAPANQAYSGANLALALGLSAGTAFNSDVPLMKFHYKSKILYVPLTGYRYSLSWDGIYVKGIVFDTADEGFLPPAGRCGTNLTIDASDNSINCTTQNFLGDKSSGTDYADTVGAVGDTLVLKGWTDESNNATVTISSITNTKIIVTGAALVSESGGKTSRFYNTKNAVTQGKTVEIGGKTYKVYLPCGAGDNPTDSYSDADRGAAGANNMWNSLILPLHEHAKLGNWTYPAYAVDASGTKITADWGFGLTDADLRTHNSYGSGSYTWCQENLNTTAWRRVIRGHVGASFLNGSRISWYSDSYYCWRPVLESL